MKTCNLKHFVFLLIGLTISSLGTLNAQGKQDKFVVVLDAGHGGKDPGRPTNFGYKEKDIALSVALQVGKLLESYKDVEVIYTRKTDVFLELHERAAIANKADADLFVSIHCNAHNSQAYGTETFVMAVKDFKRNFDIAQKENEVIFLEDNHEVHYQGFDPNSPESMIGFTIIAEENLDQSILLASYIQDNFTNALKRKNRGVKQAGLWVLHNTYMPSVLIETGFITNRTEGDYLNSKKGQKEISTEISKAIIKYKDDVFHGFGEMVTVPIIKEVEPEVVSEDQTSTSEEIYPNIVFKVQLAASSNKIDPQPYNFKGLEEVSREKVDRLYKYYYGYTSNYSKIKSMLDTAKSSGYPTAFVVAFKEGKQISLDEALKTPVN